MYRMGKSCLVLVVSWLGMLSLALHCEGKLSPSTTGSCSAPTYSTSRFRMVLPAARTSATLETMGS